MVELVTIKTRQSRGIKQFAKVWEGSPIAENGENKGVVASLKVELVTLSSTVDTNKWI